MEAEAKRKDAISVLHEEIDHLLFANRMYWEGKTLSHESDTEYHCRQDRLETIRRKLVDLDTGVSKCAPHSVRERK